MVFLSIINFVRSRGPDEMWRKRKIFKLSAHFVGRRRNCYSIAIRNVHRALQYTTKGRTLKKAEISELWRDRVMSTWTQYGLDEATKIKESSKYSDILLNQKVTGDLTIWEPKTYESLLEIHLANSKKET